MSISRLSQWMRRWRGASLLAAALYSAELLDELIFGAEGAALPLIRDELSLSYVQVGLLLSAPALFSLLLDPLIGLLGDLWHRRALMVGGALLVGLTMLLVAGSTAFLPLLVAMCLTYPGSTAYVSLAQATLMDLNPGRQDQVMARWTVLGSAGQLLGPALLTALLALGFGWRGLYAGLGLTAGLLALVLWRTPGWSAARPPEKEGRDGAWWSELRALPRAVWESGMLRWLVLLEAADLLLDVFLQFSALYFTDIVGVSPALAGGALTLLAVSGLLGDVVLIPLLERHDGLRLIRLSAALVLPLYALFLLVPGYWPKVVLLVLFSPLRAGWYQVLQARAYAALPGRSGVVVAAGSLGGLVAAAYPVILGAIAERFGLQWSMALLALAPIAILAGARRRN